MPELCSLEKEAARPPHQRMERFRAISSARPHARGSGLNGRTAWIRGLSWARARERARGRADLGLTNSLGGERQAYNGTKVEDLRSFCGSAVLSLGAQRTWGERCFLRPRGGTEKHGLEVQMGSGAAAWVAFFWRVTLRPHRAILRMVSKQLGDHRHWDEPLANAAFFIVARMGRMGRRTGGFLLACRSFLLTVLSIFNL